jgi:multiple sugar transport system permease protein
MTLRRVRQLCYTAVAIVIIAVMLFPLYWMLNVSLQSSIDLFAIPPKWFPLHPNWDGYHEAIATQSGHLVTSLIVATSTVILTLVLATPAAYALTHFKLRHGVAIVLLMLLATQMIPTVVLAQGLFGILSHIGLLDTYPALILADTTHALPFAILLLRAFMFSCPYDLFEAARVDGAGYWRVLTSIIIPLSRNGLVTAALFSFLFAWGDFLYAFTISTQDKIVPVTLGLYLFIGEQINNDYNALMATAVLASIPAAVILVFAQRYVSAGITTGGVKQ